ncbi:hypothetical protein NUU61_001130 [Penicillium alfredii]|uniref:Uncharacterized protein n=1 Tax=Penicillium alfredii TaxID=1506179 RepID=A0A9W9GB18_9EURO|nr:uncharacterized protein NUU61_001130 [Penicillium alfredii]KAJ5115371.1 hypothetical protein NUU61_001130 [Penicillium alfredii]
MRGGVLAVKYHAYTLWLFIFSDLKTIILPSTVFGIANAWAAPRYGISVAETPSSPNEMENMRRVVAQTISVIFWILANFLPFAINNQRDRSAILEDAINKPWRPFPSGRIIPSHATKLMVFLYIAAPVYSMVISGGHRQSLGLVVLGTWYNNWGGAEHNPLVRNLINALGYTCFISGALEVALGSALLPLHLSHPLAQWLLVIGAIIASTVHLQDLPDQLGDAKRGRATIPLVLGDAVARWTIAVPMLGWGLFCPVFWGINRGCFTGSTLLAWTVAIRVVVIRNVLGDKLTFRLWNCWIAMVYLMPLLSRGHIH